MITKEEFEKTKDLVYEYRKQVNSMIISEHTCVVCKTKKIKPTRGMSFDKPSEQHKGCWSGGTVDKISFGYGSKYDMESFFIAICDDCIEQLEKDKLATNVETIIGEEKKYGL